MGGFIMEQTKRTLDQVNAEIAKTQEELANVHGTTTEVYARIVGYYRAVRNWNKGKSDEFKHRKMFNLEDSKEYKISSADSGCGCSSIQKISAPVTTNVASLASSTNDISSYEFYVRKTCPNCPPVKEYMSTVNLSGNTIDVDTNNGLTQAAEKGVFASPTVIFYNAEGAEIARAHSVQELTGILEPAAVAV